MVHLGSLSLDFWAPKPHLLPQLDLCNLNVVVSLCLGIMWPQLDLINEKREGKDIFVAPGTLFGSLLKPSYVIWEMYFSKGYASP